MTYFSSTDESPASRVYRSIQLLHQHPHCIGNLRYAPCQEGLHHTARRVGSAGGARPYSAQRTRRPRLAHFTAKIHLLLHSIVTSTNKATYWMLLLHRMGWKYRYLRNILYQQCTQGEGYFSVYQGWVIKLYK